MVKVREVIVYGLDCLKLREDCLFIFLIVESVLVLWAFGAGIFARLIPPLDLRPRLLAMWVLCMFGGMLTGSGGN